MPFLLPHGLVAYITPAAVLSKYFWYILPVLHVQSENVLVGPLGHILGFHLSDHESVVVVNQFGDLDMGLGHQALKIFRQILIQV